MSLEPPFLKALTFTLMGLPKIQAGCMPMFDTGINVLNLPSISNFVNYAIGKSAHSVYDPLSSASG
jgi:Ca2+-dependent lipid-binding protein